MVAAGKLVDMWTSGHETGGGGVRRRARSAAVPPVQSFLFGHSRAEVVYDCR
ncbi:hypothetical protein [Actinomadura sp. BRA 177]|uniref:hypothetical protein n=1 Tax=Actinomadura sp. BRA 177 TaxID=2745202 RepID=UPI0015962F6A|nr:hypothetical protein [Actinomadura sp. BRA 177]NVI92899.1 hypothetical protein [Actinomadura sp. BRA 177]